MHLITKRGLSLFGLTVASALVTANCDGDTPGGTGGGLVPDLLEECGLTCAAEGIMDGNASISGVASVDAFFSAVISVRDASFNATAAMRAELDGLAASLEIEGYADMEISALAAEIKASIQAKLTANVQGSLVVNYEPAKCEVNLEVSAKAAAECDVDVDPGSVNVECQGSCEVSAEVAAECQASGNLTCEGTAPNFQCEGTCTGSCQLEVAASCEATCNGSCEGTCTACAGGACDNEGGVVANCAGTCEGSCQGECKLEAGGSCSGSCEGSCEYTPATASCEGGATAKCDASAQANVECQGSCEGEVKPPEVKAECEASVEAKATAEVSCTPPSLSIDFQFSADLDAAGKAEFKAWLEGFKARFSAMLAIQAKIAGPSGSGGLTAAISGLGVAAKGAVTGAVETYADADVSLKAKIGLGCAVNELGQVSVALQEAGSGISASASAFLEVSGSVNARSTR